MSTLRISHEAVRRGTRTVLQPATIEVAAPAAIAVVGVNGSGKTSLFMQLTGTLLGGRGRSSISIGNRAATLAYVPQVPALPGWTRIDQIARYFGSTEQALNDAMPQLLLHEIAGLRVSQLSIGQRQALAIALALTRRADVTILDEPFSGLDFRRRLGALQLLRDVITTGRSIVLSSQSAADLAGVCDHYVVIRDGRYVFNAPARHLCDPTSVEHIEDRLMQLLM